MHFTSAAVNGLPSCHFTPSRSLNVSAVPSSFHDHSVARSGTIDSKLTCGLCWSNMMRLLKTPIIGISTTSVAPSCIDMLPGLSGLYSLRTPPLFCAQAELPAVNKSSSSNAIKRFARLRLMAWSFPVRFEARRIAAFCLAEVARPRRFALFTQL